MYESALAVCDDAGAYGLYAFCTDDCRLCDGCEGAYGSLA